MRNVVYYDSTINMTNTAMRFLEEQRKTSQVATIVNTSSVSNRFPDSSLGSEPPSRVGQRAVGLIARTYVSEKVRIT
ncbi:hypothetical protein CA13_60930 [Planctomycetes bacterium CA13]|uniref:Uncharacterized protein n=1 Tax=Novipirellula herctigrandis TaxID=2527986 RepID=A0A5C5ZDK0_9BACT|nr:hypothetical protein CA13_60930 [Planctomycetes bacterium CA13]